MKKITLLVSGICFIALSFASLANAATARAAAITPAEISTLATVSAIDQDEILLGVITLHKTVPNDVKKLGQMMVDQHGANLAEIMQMAHQFHIGSLNSPMSQPFLMAAQQDMRKLGALNGKSYSLAYVNAMVNGHEAALHLIDTKLMKTATTPELKAFMVATRKAVAMHLACALKVKKELQ